MYNPDRVTRQLGYVQRVPQEVIFFGKAYRPPNSRKYEVEFHDLTHIDKLWKRFAADGYAASLILASLTPVPDGVPYLCEDDYDTWFMGHSHPYICPAFAAFPPTVVVPDRSHTEYVSLFTFIIVFFKHLVVVNIFLNSYCSGLGNITKSFMDLLKLIMILITRW